MRVSVSQCPPCPALSFLHTGHFSKALATDNSPLDLVSCTCLGTQQGSENKCMIRMTKSSKKSIFLTSFRYLQSTVPSVGDIGLVSNRHSPALKDFSAGKGKIWRQTTLGENDGVYQRPTLGPWQPRAGGGPCLVGRRTEKATDTRCLLSVLALLTLCLGRTCRGIGEPGKKQRLSVCPLQLHFFLPLKDDLYPVGHSHSYLHALST